MSTRGSCNQQKDIEWLVVPMFELCVCVCVCVWWVKRFRMHRQINEAPRERVGIDRRIKKKSIFNVNRRNGSGKWGAFQKWSVSSNHERRIRMEKADAMEGESRVKEMDDECESGREAKKKWSLWVGTEVGNWQLIETNMAPNDRLAMARHPAVDLDDARDANEGVWVRPEKSLAIWSVWKAH